MNRIIDVHARIPAEIHRRFWGSIWPEAVRTFHRGGIELQCKDTQGAVKFSAGDRPIIEGLDRARLNLVLTSRVPMLWDQVRGLAGVTTIYERATMSLIALEHAHGMRVPFMNTNTVVHEMLHAIMGDILIRRPTWYQTNSREIRADAYATRLWMFGDGTAVRSAAVEFIKGLK